MVTAVTSHEWHLADQKTSKKTCVLHTTTDPSTEPTANNVPVSLIAHAEITCNPVAMANHQKECNLIRLTKERR